MTLHSIDVTPVNPSHTKYRPDIDGLRAVAVIAVVLFHAFPEWVRGGFVGVDVFFVISGYLISSIIFQNLDNGTFSFADFYARRVKRIFPALILVLAACYAFGYVSLFPDENKQLGKHIASGAGFLSNFVLWNESGYFDMASETKPLLHLWSLGIEEQFYMLWPLLVFFAWKRRFNVLAIIFVVCLASFALNVARVRIDPTGTFYSPASRFWELMIGSLLAYLSAHDKWLEAKAGPVLGKLRRVMTDSGLAQFGVIGRNLGSALGLLFILMPVLLLDRNRAFPGWWALLPTVGAYLLISTGSQTWINRTFLSHPVMVWFGLISFPLYLWHWPLLAFTRVIMNSTPPLEIRGGIVAVSIVLAWVTYRVVEKPIRSGGFVLPKVAVLGTLMMLAAIGGMYSYNRATGQSGSGGPDPAAFVWDKANYMDEGCARKYPLAANCLIAKPNQAIDVLVIGDSHANHLYPGLKNYYAAKNQNVANLGVGVCLPFLNLATPNNGQKCLPPITQILNEAISNPSVHTVILAGYWRSYVNSGFQFELANHPKLAMKLDSDGACKSVSCQTAQHKIIATAIEETVSRLTAANKHVILFFDVAKLDFEPRGCVRRKIAWSEEINNRIYNNTCEVTAPSGNVVEQEFARIAASSLNAKNLIQVFNPRDYLCVESQCMAMRNNRMLYRDNNHLSTQGSTWLAKKYSF
jgi:peptidoglycan/LPS O-acetylase OafA/YrhL